MEFKIFNEQIQKQFAIMCKTGKLFRSSVTGIEVWNLYLSSFKDAKIFRDPESSEHNCNNCNNFIRRYGNIVSINNNGNIESIFSNIDNVGEYTDSAKACVMVLETSSIVNVFFETFNELKNLPYESCNKSQELFQLGVVKNLKKYTKEEADKFGVVNSTDVYEFNHLNIKLPKEFVDNTTKSIEAIMAHYRDKYQVFKRCMEEIPLDTLNLVKDLINQASLLDGIAHLHSIDEIIKESFKYQLCSTSNSIDNWFWSITYNMEEHTAKFKNTLVGVLCTELAEGIELNKACTNWNKRVDPINYHKVTAPITKKQIAEAKKFMEENDYIESFDRRLATIDDIKVSEILHSNIGDGKIKSVSVFDNVKATSTQHKRAEFDNVEEISIDKFMNDILPTCTMVEAFLTNKMEGNLVTLTTANNKESKSILKWNNNYSWTFNGNIAGKSQIKDAVKSRGGNIEAVVRVSLAFPDTTDDYDLRLIEPNGYEIYYNNVRNLSPCLGMLDLDAQGVDGNQIAEKRVENITYRDKSSMKIGDYIVRVINYSARKLHTKFTIEVEIDNEITLLEFINTNTHNNREDVVNIQYDGQGFKIIANSCMKLISSNTISKEIWGIETNNFHKVDLICLSPNYWDTNKVGNKHYMFMLNKCKTSTLTRGFHNENLNAELLKHRKVVEVLGGTNMIESTDKQLSGIGFNSTVRNELLVKIQGSHKRMLKIKF